MFEAPPSLEQWLDQGSAYLSLTWWVAHPFVAVIAVVVLLVLAQAILGLVSNLIKQLLLLIVKSPYLLLQWLLAKSSKSLNMPTMSLQSPKQRQIGKQGTVQERLLTVLTQLESTRQQQDQLLKELKTILAESKPQSSKSTNRPSVSSSPSPPPAEQD